MRKNVLALSIATMLGGLCIAGGAIAGVIPGTNPVSASGLGVTDASQLQIAPGGIGHILVVPYFTAQNGNNTVISLINTDLTNGKALKVRFRGASNSDDILDFTLLMSPGDVWNGTVTATTPTSVAQLTTSDKSCTYPSIAAGGGSVGFSTQRLSAAAGPAGLQGNTREGYVEIFNMADIPPLTGTAAGTSNSALYNTIKHSSGVATCSTTVLDAALFTDTTQESVAASRGLATPTTGIFGNWTIINVPNTTTFTGSATAVRAMNATTDGRGNYVLFPQSASLLADNSVVAENFTADPSMAVNTSAAGLTKAANGLPGTAISTPPVIGAAFYDLPDMSTPYITNPGLQAAIANAALNDAVASNAFNAPRAQASILTTALAVTSIKDEYATEPGVQATTDWTFSSPTRRYSVAMDYRGTTPVRVFSNVPFNNTLGTGTGQFFYTGNTPVSAGQICVTPDGNASFFDREEQKGAPGSAVFSPQPVGATISYCGEVSVLSFGSGASVLGAAVARQSVAPGFVNGWASIGTTNAANGSIGMPVLGSSFIKLVNGAALAGTSGTYGITLDHRYSK